MKIVVFGANGMLGRYVTKRLLRSGHEVAAITRNEFDIVAFCTDSLYKFRAFDETDVIINCAGTIKPRMKDVGIENALLVNSFFPHILAKQSEIIGARMVHVTTDCVYSGNKGSYVESDLHDALDDYGKSKSLGEPSNCAVIRTSIIGEELGRGRSLLNWAISQKGGEVNGFTNHIWNGITCLTLASFMDNMISNNFFWTGTRHIFSPTPYTKYAMLDLFNKVYDLDLKIKAIEANERVDRTLATKYKDTLATYRIPDLAEQVLEMKLWSASNL